MNMEQWRGDKEGRTLETLRRTSVLHRPPRVSVKPRLRGEKLKSNRLNYGVALSRAYYNKVI